MKSFRRYTYPLVPQRAQLEFWDPWYPETRLDSR